MRTYRLSLLLGTALLLLPATAGAYVSPEDILFSPDFSLPPSPRGAEQRVELQRQQSADRRADMFNQLHGAAPDDTEGLPAGATGAPDFLDIQQILELLQQEQGTDVMRNAAGEDPTETSDKTAADGEEEWMEGDVSSGLSPREARILDRVERNRELGRVLSDGDVIETMHGGAPLSHTGPGLMIAGTALLCGAAWTLARPGKATAMAEKN